MNTQPMSFDQFKPLIGFTETSISVQNLGQAKSFYQQALGMVVEDSDDGWALLKEPMNEQRILLRECTFIPGISLSLELSDFSKGLEKLKSLGATIIEDHKRGDFSYAKVQSPDGQIMLAWSSR